MPVPPTVLPLVKAFIICERFEGMAIDRERMRYPDALTIAIDFVRRTEPSDIHVAVGNLEPAERRT